MRFLKFPEKLFLQIRRGPIFASPEGSYFCQSGWVLFFPIRPEGAYFANPAGGGLFCQYGGEPICQSGGVLFLPIRKSPNFVNPEGSFLPIRRGSISAYPEGSTFCQFGRFHLSLIRRGPILS